MSSSKMRFAWLAKHHATRTELLVGLHKRRHAPLAADILVAMPLGHAPSTLCAHIDIPPELAGSLVVLAISIVIVLIVWKARGAHGGFAKHQGTVVKAGAPFHTCGMEAKWMLPQGHWHCDRCNVAVTETAPAAAPVAMAPPAVHSALPQSAQCPTCFGPGRWIPESNAWGCDRCRALIPTPQPR